MINTYETRNEIRLNNEGVSIDLYLVILSHMIFFLNSFIKPHKPDTGTDRKL